MDSFLPTDQVSTETGQVQAAPWPCRGVAARAPGRAAGGGGAGRRPASALRWVPAHPSAAIVHQVDKNKWTKWVDKMEWTALPKGSPADRVFDVTTTNSGSS